MGVGPSGYGFTEYNMSVNINLFDDEFELPNNDFITAAPIAEGYYSNLILRDDLLDYYYLFLNEADTITISLDYFPVEFEEAGDTFDSDIDLMLFSDYTGTEYPRVGQSITLGNESISYIASSSGKYFILCILFDGEIPNPYNLTINIDETDDSHEDNDVFADATRITVVEGPTGDTVSHTETPRIRIKDDDYFVVHVPTGLTIIVEISQFGAVDIDLELLSMNGSIIEASTLDSGFSERVGPFTINTTNANLNNDTDIYFRVFMSTGLSTSYFLNVTIGPEEISSPLPFSDWGDVVHVNYSLWLDPEHTIEVEGNIGVVLEYIYLRRSPSERVPREVFQALPVTADEYLQQIYLQAFIDEIIGMQVNEEKSFMIAAEDAYGDQDLFYHVTLLALVYDASAITSTSEFTSETSSTTSSIETTGIEFSTSESTTLPNITSLPDIFFIFSILFTSMIVIKRKRRNRTPRTYYFPINLIFTYVR